MFSAIATAAILTQQVLTQVPCYVTKPSMCPEEKFTMVVIPAPLGMDGRMPIQQEESPYIADVTFVLVTGFTNNTGAMATIVVPGIADENECHKLALKLNTPKHACFEYRLAVPHADVADAVQDELQDSGIIR